MNIDGSSLGNPCPSGFGGVVCSSDETWLVGYDGHIYCDFWLSPGRAVSDSSWFVDQFSDSTMGLLIDVHPFFHRYASLLIELSGCCAGIGRWFANTCSVKEMRQQIFWQS